MGLIPKQPDDFGYVCKITSVGEKAISVVCLKEAEQHCQDGHDQQNVEGNVCQVWERLLQCVCHHGDAGLNVPAAP